MGHHTEELQWNQGDRGRHNGGSTTRVRIVSSGSEGRPPRSSMPSPAVSRNSLSPLYLSVREAAGNRAVCAAVQRLAFFADTANAEPATATPPRGEVVWVTPLVGANHALHPDAASAAAAVAADLGVVGQQLTHSTSGGASTASHGTYDYWFDDAVPTVLKGRPTHDTDATNRLFRVTPSGYRAYAPIVHKHAAT